ncbi:acyl-CoA thioesterase/bile acid-CoA:amino acid N-acyltransferase family protein [Actinoplanes sichuanensis]|uniref:Acyl-CoA thioesterase/BAAT N-terminal domain-containing protein n=1 Tax=Actinoplanes sichuanensis TaxID=512349 RepID=A0ABW4AQ18_9ACTN|nr:acyl-CoA thioesterase/bile acid-CoA:amino acid N-acyltransferase family protein [Actinoplanes sichuanensis]BEL04931.1 acyl-CoA thioesterase/bile acid-CoA:amino acid N-acyltransferase family protein [Actinoplanes sichuanensis]
MFRRAVAVVLLLATVPACSAVDEHPVMTVDAAVVLADERVGVRVTGLVAGSTVTIRSETVDRNNVTWRGTAVVQTDRAGVADLDVAPSTGGSYQGVDGMGLFWSMVPEGGDPDTGFLAPARPERGPLEVRLTATGASGATASAVVRRQWLGEGVTHRRVLTGGLVADVYVPPAGGRVRRPVLIFGGSEGGSSQLWEAAQLASHGHPAMALAYFDAPGLPATLDRVPLEYFAAALRHLAAQSGGGPVTVIGYSRGSEAALLVGQHFPDLVRGVVVYAPSDVVHAGYPYDDRPAWTFRGEPVARGPIPVDRISGGLLAIAGGDDELWDSVGSARRLRERRPDFEILVYPRAGHFVGTLPHIPTGVGMGGLRMGGTRADDQLARVEGWPRVLAMLAAS